MPPKNVLCIVECQTLKIKADKSGKKDHKIFCQILIRSLKIPNSVLAAIRKTTYWYIFRQ